MSLLDSSPEALESQLDMLVLMLQTIGVFRGVLRRDCAQRVSGASSVIPPTTSPSIDPNLLIAASITFTIPICGIWELISTCLVLIRSLVCSSSTGGFWRISATTLAAIWVAQNSLNSSILVFDSTILSDVGWLALRGGEFLSLNE